MNTLLIFFAFPIAVIIISAILQKLLNNPIAVAALIFAIFIIVTFAAFDETFLIATLAYTILAFITAFLVSRFCEHNNNCLCNNIAQILQNNTTTTTSNDSLQDLLENINQNNNTCNSTANTNDDNVLGTNTCGCGCGRMRRYRRF